MEATFVEMGETIKKLMKETGVLRQENAVLKWTNEELVGGGKARGNEHVESWHVPMNTVIEE